MNVSLKEIRLHYHINIKKLVPYKRTENIPIHPNLEKQSSWIIHWLQITNFYLVRHRFLMTQISILPMKSISNNQKRTCFKRKHVLQELQSLICFLLVFVHSRAYQVISYQWLGHLPACQLSLL
jgi:hypothetical protein